MTNTIDPEKGFLIDCMTDFFDEFVGRNVPGSPPKRGGI